MFDIHKKRHGTVHALYATLTAVALAVASAVVSAADKPSTEAVERFEMRSQLMKEYPHILDAMQHSPHDGFGGKSSRAIAYRMYSRTNEDAIADARAKLEIESHGEGTWFLRLPYVNIAVFETSEGLVLVDSGYAPAGPVLLDTLRELSDKPVHTLIITHHHADHAYGAWSLLEAGETPQIIATDAYVDEVGLDLRLANYTNVLLNNQDPRDVPRSWDDATRPTRTFHGTLSIEVGGEEFVLHQARGETEDQLWVHVPERDTVVSADYHQPFLPNAGNGKRRQRYIAEWARALRDMAAVQPQLLLPMHGPAVTEPQQIQDDLLLVADALAAIESQVAAALNAGQRQHEVPEQVALPEELAGHEDLDEFYNRAEDVGKMVVKQYTGWWDNIPSHWTPASMTSRAQEIARLAGGIDNLVARTRALIEEDPALACHLADWAYFAAPDDAAVLRAGIEAYAARIHGGVPLQEILVYLSHMTELQWRLEQL